MSVLVALLRGINVGGHRKVPMSDLRTLVEELGHTDVCTYIQSGNIVFTSTAAQPAKVIADMEERIEQEFGFAVKVIVRTHKELAAVIERNPFGAAASVMFLDRVPDLKRVRALDPKEFAPDEFAIVKREVFVHCPGGYGRTKINNTFFEKKLAVEATTRNWNTVRKLTEMTARPR